MAAGQSDTPRRGPTIEPPHPLGIAAAINDYDHDLRQSALMKERRK